MSIDLGLTGRSEESLRRPSWTRGRPLVIGDVLWWLPRLEPPVMDLAVSPGRIAFMPPDLAGLHLLPGMLALGLEEVFNRQAQIILLLGREGLGIQYYISEDRAEQLIPDFVPGEMSKVAGTLLQLNGWITARSEFLRNLSVPNLAPAAGYASDRLRPCLN
jgi:hypothetical protein